jgi:thymidylate kinase
MIGNLYILEGPDGAGKTTLAHLLTDTLQGRGIKCEYLAFPGRREGTLGYHIYQLHHGPAQFGIETLDPASLQILHVAAHVDAIRQLILPMLSIGTTIVLDRYWWSAQVYGQLSGLDSKLVARMIDLEMAAWGDTLPSRAFLISRSQSLRDDLPIAQWSALAEAYKKLAASQLVKHPISIIVNENAVGDALQSMIEQIHA